MPNLYKTIPGWMDYENLYDYLITNHLKNDSTFVEVGVWKGRSICYMAELAKEKNINLKIFGIDIFANKVDDEFHPYKIEKNKTKFINNFNVFENTLNSAEGQTISSNESIYFEFLFNLAQKNLLDKVVPICLFSEDAANLFEDESIDCLFLDAAHDRDNILNDLKNWVPKIKKGGILCGHDYAPGWSTQPFVDEFFANLNQKVEFYPPQSFIWKNIY